MRSGKSQLKHRNSKKKHVHGKLQHSDSSHEIIENHRSSGDIRLLFNLFAKKVSDFVGSAFTFILALLIIIIWAVSGHYFQYSDTWQLIINTGTTIITFLVVFLIQNTQNRDTEILNLKIDELIKAKKGARNELINLNELSDAELKQLEKEFTKLKDKRTGI